MPLAWSLDLDPASALRFFRRKGLRTSFSWQDMWQEEHDAAFTVAKMMDLDLLRDVREVVDSVIENGQTFADFRKKLEPELVKRGWWGRADMEDPQTGEIKSVQLGSTRRLETIFRTNMMTSYAARDWEQIRETSDSASYLMYDAVDDNRTRPAHKAWDGTTLRWDDPWWQSHRPPNGYACRCSVVQLSDADLRAMGKTPAARAPVVTTREFTNRRTGEITRVPDGIDPDFAYNPGAASLRTHHAKLFADRVAAAPAMMGATSFASLTQQSRAFVRSLDEGWAQFVDNVTAHGQPRREWFTVGAMSPLDVDFLVGRGISPVSAEIAADDRLIVGAKAARHTRAGDALTDDEMKGLPAAVRNPEAVLYDTSNETLLYVVPSRSDPRSTKIVVRPNFEVRKPKQALNAVRTAYKVGASALKFSKDYVLVRGKIE